MDETLIEQGFFVSGRENPDTYFGAVTSTCKRHVRSLVEANDVEESGVYGSLPLRGPAFLRPYLT
jgi:hypothetical protein